MDPGETSGRAPGGSAGVDEAELRRRLDQSLEERHALERRNHELEQSNEALERFAYVAAHDLKAPLARIEMALAAGRPPTDPDQAALLDIARRGASRMRQLIEDLLTHARIGTGAVPAGWVDLDALVAEVLADLGAVIEDTGATIEVSPLPRAWGHAPLLGQVVQNLVANALKFQRVGGGGVIEISGREDETDTWLSVADNGIGIDPSHREEVFGVFTRLNGDDRYAGSGIGLATCAKVVAFHGGSIKVEDGIDGGITVVVRLPTPEPGGP